MQRFVDGLARKARSAGWQAIGLEANLRFSAPDFIHGEAVPPGLQYPQCVKPVKAAFSVLAAFVQDHARLHAHTRIGPCERRVLRHRIEPI